MLTTLPVITGVDTISHRIVNFSQTWAETMTMDGVSRTLGTHQLFTHSLNWFSIRATCIAVQTTGRFGISEYRSSNNYMAAVTVFMSIMTLLSSS